MKYEIEKGKNNISDHLFIFEIKTKPNLKENMQLARNIGLFPSVKFNSETSFFFSNIINKKVYISNNMTEKKIQLILKNNV